MSLPTTTPQPCKAVLLMRGIRQSDVARTLGISGEWLGRVLNGHYRPSADLAEKLSQLLDVPASELFVEDPENLVIEFVRRTTSESGVPERLEDPAIAERVAGTLRAAAP